MGRYAKGMGNTGKNVTPKHSTFSYNLFLYITNVP